MIKNINSRLINRDSAGLVIERLGARDWPTISDWMIQRRMLDGGALVGVAPSIEARLREIYP